MPARQRWGERVYEGLPEFRRETGQELLDAQKLGLFADPQWAVAPMKKPSDEEDWAQALSVFKPGPNSIVLARGMAVDAGPRAGLITDILGHEIRSHSWPLGAVGPGK